MIDPGPMGGAGILFSGIGAKTMSKSDIDFIDLTDLAGADARETQGGEREDE